MYGSNTKVGPDYSGGDTLHVVEIFDTVQGEGPWSGIPSTFIRLQYCNLACYFCDTEFEKGSEMTLEQIYSALPDGVSHVVLTGGEPMRQNIVPLCRMLNDSNIAVQIETAGTLFPPGMEEVLWEDDGPNTIIVCSPKTPQIHPNVRDWCRDYKYIIRDGETSEEDGLPTQSTQVYGSYSMLYRPSSARATIWVQPMDEHDIERNAVNTRAALRCALTHGHRISLQLHKILGLQ